MKNNRFYLFYALWFEKCEHDSKTLIANFQSIIATRSEVIHHVLSVDDFKSYFSCLCKLCAAVLHIRNKIKKHAARNTSPASPTHFMCRFSCSCMNGRRPRQYWCGRGWKVHFRACKIMHPMHARAIWGWLARKKAVLGEAEGECPAMLSRAAGRSVISAG